MISHDELKRLLRYDPDTGIFTRVGIVPKCFRKSWGIGTVAGTLHRTGYWMIWLFKERYLAHRLAFFYMTGKWPVDQIDHINRIRSDNRWSNLREVTKSTNLHNRVSASPKNKTGLLGVIPARSSYKAMIEVNGTRHYLGIYKTAQQAHEAYMKAKERFHLQADKTASSSAL